MFFQGFCISMFGKFGKDAFRALGMEYDLQPGNCIFVNANVMHFITEKEDCRCHSFLILPKMPGFLRAV